MTRPDSSHHQAPLGSRALVLLLVLIGVGTGLLGAACADEKVREKERSGGATLSDAAKETAKKPAEQKVLHVAGESGCQNCSVFAVVVEGSGGGPTAGTVDLAELNSPPPAFHFGVVAEAGSLGSPDFAGATLYGLRLGINDRNRTSLDLVLLGGAAHFTAGSDLAARFRGPAELAADGSLRYSLTPPDAPIGIAPVLGFRVGWLSWNYLNGIWLERDGYVSEVFDDGVKHYSPYLGLAVTVFRSRHMDLAVTGITGWRFYDDHTDTGLRNDLFDQDHFNQVRLETRFSL